MRFEVEHIGRDGEQVFAKQLDAGDFELGRGATLGGRSIQAQLSQPRAFDESGAPRTDLYAFTFAEPGRAQQWKLGEVVVLRTGRPGGSRPRADLGPDGPASVVSEMFADLSEQFEFLDEGLEYYDGPISGFLRSKTDSRLYAFDCSVIVQACLFHWCLVPVDRVRGVAAEVVRRMLHAGETQWLSIVEDRRSEPAVCRMATMRGTVSPSETSTAGVDGGHSNPVWVGVSPVLGEGREPMPLGAPLRSPCAMGALPLAQHEVSNALGSEWEYPSGFFARLRSGDFDPSGAARVLALLTRLELRDDEPLDRGLIRQLWFLPVFCQWQEERVAELKGDVDALLKFTSDATDSLMEKIGVP